MPVADASDGVKLNWSERGAGPAVLLVPYWSMHPSVFEPLVRELESDFRVVQFDERGSGMSTRVGPYDLETDASDLETVCEAAGPVAVALCLTDASNRAARVAARRPDLIESLVCVGSAPLSFTTLEGSEALISSRAVLDAFMQQIENDFRGAIRAALSGANFGLTEEEVRVRVQLQVDYTSGEAAAKRARAWAADTAGGDAARALGERLHVIMSEAMGGGGGWFPSADEMTPLIEKSFPESGLSWASNGIVSAPAEIAAVIARVAARERDYDRSSHG